MTPSEGPVDVHQLELELVDIHKVFPDGTRALSDVEFRLRPGTVHGLVGSNGAGKSTLIKILAGVFPPSRGRIVVRGQERRWERPADAAAAGLATIHQHVPLAQTLSVIENIFLGWTPRYRHSRAERERFFSLVERLGFPLDPDAIVGTLPIGSRQLVAIAQALAIGANVVVMDEPTASLSRSEREVVFSAIRRLRAQGTSFIYVSHFLDEIIELTDEVTVLRDGQVVDHRLTTDFDPDSLVMAIVGRQVLLATKDSNAPDKTTSRPLLEVTDLSTATGVAGVSMEVHPGEIVGIAGLLGSGRTELLRGILGADRREGNVRVDGKLLKASVTASIGAGIGFVPEDRNANGLMLDASLVANISMPYGPDLREGWLRASRSKELARTNRAIEDLHIVAAGPDVPVRSLSGGNAQKALFGRWLASGARILLLDEPMAGIDIGAKAQLAGKIREFAASGGAVVVADSEYEELLAITDRVYVMRKGRLVAEVRSDSVTEHDLLTLSSGLSTGVGA